LSFVRLHLAAVKLDGLRVGRVIGNLAQVLARLDVDVPAVAPGLAPAARRRRRRGRVRRRGEKKRRRGEEEKRNKGRKETNLLRIIQYSLSVSTPVTWMQ